MQEEGLSKPLTAIVGISIGNSYFTKETVCRLLDATTKAFPRVHVIVPEAPSRYNYLAQGKTVAQAHMLAKRKARALERRIDAAVEKLEPWQRERVERMRWDGSEGAVDRSVAFQHARMYVNGEGELKRIAEQVSAGVAVNYLLDEMAYLYTLHDCVIIYHRPMAWVVHFIAMTQKRDLSMCIMDFSQK